MLEICEKCKNEFECGVDASSCWCQDLELATGSADELRRCFKRCLCPQCLKLYSKDSPKPADGTSQK